MEYEYRDITKNPLEPQEVHILAEQAGLDARELINPKSTAFKALKLDMETLTPARAAEVISETPKAMFRPLLTDGQQIVIGFKPEEMKNLID